MTTEQIRQKLENLAPDFKKAIADCKDEISFKDWAKSFIIQIGAVCL